MIVRHPSTTFQMLFSWRGTLLPKILPAIGTVMLLSAVISGLKYNNLYHFPDFPLMAFTLLGIVLSLFLGFKNNSCYDRWWEARKLWGVLIVTARHLARDCRILPQARRERAIEQVIIFANVLRDRLRHHTLSDQELKNILGLNEQQIQHYSKQHNAPQYSLSLLQWEFMQALKEGEISDICYTQLNAHLHQMSTVHTGCDRIASTPFPYAYSVLLTRTIYGFCLLLPFSLSNYLGLITPFVIGLLAYTFLGLDALSSELEEPFGIQSNDLPLDAMVRTIEIDLLSSLGRPTPKPLSAHERNLL